MRRTSGAWVGFALVLALALTATGCVPYGVELGGPSGGTGSVGAEMMPDPDYRPNIGDRAVLFGVEDGGRLERLPLLKDVTAYDIFVRGHKARDADRLLELEEQGWLRWAAPGTRVIVVGILDRNHTGTDTASQVRVADEGRKGEAFWTPSNYINRLIPRPTE